jgi:F-type H+-transporting ATPase subunit gamma
MSKHHDKVIENYVNLFNEMNFSVSKDVASFLLDLYLEKGYGRIDVLYNEFKSAIQQNLTIKPILPITPYIPAAIEDPKEDEAGGDDSEVTTLDYIYEPDEDTIIEELGVKYINVEVWRIMLESSASEQGARMTAMDSATENAAEMIDKLVLTYNRIRQAGITKEIIEIASGAEAIK